MFDQLEFTLVPGKPTKEPLRLLSLSTCGFCKKAMEFLEAKGLSYEFQHMDLVDPSIKQRVKDEYFRINQKTLSYPTLFRGQDILIVGFIPKVWEEVLTDELGS